MLYSLEGNDDSYLEIVDKYDNTQPKGERAIDLYSAAFGHLQQGMAETDADLLGVIYEELGMDSDHFGQYFTPHRVSGEIAEMSIAADELRDCRDEPYTIADPASGTGRLLIYAAKQIPGEIDAVFYGQDKDLTCAKMTALNLCFFNMDGYAVYGDSLKVEQRKMWQTRGSPLGGEIRELDVEEHDNPFDQALEEDLEDLEQADTEDNNKKDSSNNVVDLRETKLDDFQ